jgi:molybdenum cofactor cytidylyltransferase
MDGAIVLLADMPAVSAETIDRLLAAFRPGGAVVPVHDGRRGNPVVWSRRFFPDLLAVTGDKGGREVLAAAGKAVIEVPAGAEIALDVDTPEALAEAQGQPA